MYVHKMELKVWVEGIQRVICGVTEATTCQDVVIALAHATGKTGRFTLVERWRDSERLLAPTEPPLRVLHKWGEYASDVQFILRHSDKDRRKGGGGGMGTGVGGGTGGADHGSKRTERFLHNFTPHGGGLLGGTQGPGLPQRRSSGSSIRKSLTFSGAHSFFPPVKSSSPAPTNKPTTTTGNATHNNNKSTATNNNTPTTPMQNSSLESLDEQLSSASFSSKSSSSPYASLDKQRRQYAVLGGSLERKGLRPSPHRSPRPGSPPRHSKTSPRLQQHNQQQHQHQHQQQHQHSQQQQQQQRVPIVNHHKLPLDNKVNNIQHPTNNNNIAKIVGTPHIDTPTEEYDLDRGLTSLTSPAVVVTPDPESSRGGGIDYAKVNGTLCEGEVAEKVVRHSPTPNKDDLMKLVRLQQERLTVQDSQIKILDSEIQYWEGREQDFDKQYAAVQEETTRLQQTEKALDDSLQELDLVSWVDKLEIEKQQQKMLQSELTLVRSQMANAESELLSAKSKAHSLTSELEVARREQLTKEQEAKEKELKVLQEISELQKQVNKKMLQHEQNQGSLEQLAAEVKSLESAILEKKTQIADCEKELRSVNMDVFIKAPSTDWLQPPATLEIGKAEKSHGRLSPSRPGSSRRMIHNPQLLKETVATTKNPHGMWV